MIKMGEDMAEQTTGKDEIYDMLDKRGIWHLITDHPALWSMSDVCDVEFPYPECDAKNLFLRDDKKRAFFLVVAHEDTVIDLKHLHKQLGSRRLSFASADMLNDKLGLEQGSVTPFGIFNDDAREVTLVFDENLAHQRFDAHPMVNTATMFIEMDEVLPLFEERGNPIVLCDLTCQTGPAAD